MLSVLRCVLLTSSETFLKKILRFGKILFDSVGDDDDIDDDDDGIVDGGFRFRLKK